ncbi:MAG: two-component regulator propeller domain-containing protein, partial [Kangiellaceae bacterium]|nr:two-component regulator propeller domain-containing protein [Kangiellaceae bacterium]
MKTILKRNYTLPFKLIIFSLFAILISSFKSVVAAAESIEVTPKLFLRHYNIEDGLSLSTVSGFAQDKYGFMWIGTEEGLNRFDGYEFEVFKHDAKDDSSLSNSMVNKLLYDSQQRLWVATEGGVSRFQQGSKSFVNYFPVDNNPSSSVKNIGEDIFGRVWVLANNRLYVFDENKEQFSSYIKFFTPSTINVSSNISAFSIVGPDVYYGQKNCLFKLDLINSITSKNCLGVPGLEEQDIKITQIYSGNKRDLWIGLEKGLILLDSISGNTRYFSMSDTGESNISNNFIEDITSDADGNIWVATYGGLNIYRQEKQKFDIYFDNQIDDYSLRKNNIRALYLDRQDVMWIGTYGGGFHLWHKETEQFEYLFSRKDASDLNATNMVHSVASDELGNLWIGSFGSGLFYYNFVAQTVSKIDFGKGSDQLDPYITGLHFDRNSVLWIGTSEGLFHYYRETGKLVKFKDENFDAYITNIASNNDGDIFVSPVDKVFQFQLNDKSDYTTLKGKNLSKIITDLMGNKTTQINTITQDLNENIWIGTVNGLVVYQSKIDKAHLFRFDENNISSISDNYVQVIYEDSFNNIWIGTANGLNYIDSSNQLSNVVFKRFNESSGLKNDSIYGVNSDSDGNLWMSSSFGLFKYQYKDDSFEQFTHVEGLQSNEFNMWASYQLPNGAIIYSGINGVTKFFTASKSDKGNIFPLQIISSNKTISLAVDGSYSPVFIENTTDLFELKVSAIDYINLNKIRYRYRITGLSNNWIVLGDKRTISLIGLEPGNYQLEIQYTSSDDVWSETTVVPLIVEQSIFFSTTAYAIYLLTLISITLYAVRLIVNRNQKVVEQISARLNDEKNKSINLQTEIEKLIDDKNQLEYELLKSGDISNELNLVINKLTLLDNTTHLLNKQFLLNVMQKEDDYLASNHIDRQHGALIAINLTNVDDLIANHNVADIEIAFSKLCSEISDNANGKDKIARWGEYSLQVIADGSYSDIKERYKAIFEALVTKRYDIGNGYQISFDISFY